MDDLRHKAMKRREELRQELSEIEAFLAVYDRFSRTQDEHSDASKVWKAGDSSEPAPERKKDNGAPARLAAAAEDVIREVGRPLTRGQLVEFLAARGVTIPSEDKARYLGTILWRKPERFENIDGKGYWLRGLPVPHPKPDVFE